MQLWRLYKPHDIAAFEDSDKPNGPGPPYA